MSANYTKLVDVATMAKVLSVKSSFIRHLVFKKRIPYIKIGKLIRFDVNQVLLEINTNNKERK